MNMSTIEVTGDVITNASSVNGNVLFGAGFGTPPNIKQGTFTTSATRNTTGTFDTGYVGDGYPIALLVYVDGGMYNNTEEGNNDWYNLVARYDVGALYMVKSRITSAPTYSNIGADNYGVVAVTYKNSDTSPTQYTRSGGVTSNSYTSSLYNASTSNCAIFKGDGRTVSYFIGNKTYSAIGLSPSTKYAYIVVYSS